MIPVAIRLGDRRHRPEAGPTHRRVLDPQGRRHRDPSDLRCVRRQGPGHRHPEFRRRIPAEVVPLVRLWVRPHCNLIDGMDMAVPVFGRSRSTTSPAPSPRRRSPPLRESHRTGRRLIRERVDRRARRSDPGPDHHRGQRRGTQVEGNQPSAERPARERWPDQG